MLLVTGQITFAASVPETVKATPGVATPLTLTTPDNVYLGSTSVPTKEAVLLPVILTTGALAGAQVSVDPVVMLIEGATVKLDPAGALQA